jgi:hypothetical protein
MKWRARGIRRSRARARHGATRSALGKTAEKLERLRLKAIVVGG